MNDSSTSPLEVIRKALENHWMTVETVNGGQIQRNVINPDVAAALAALSALEQKMKGPTVINEEHRLPFTTPEYGLVIGPNYRLHTNDMDEAVTRAAELNYAYSLGRDRHLFPSVDKGGDTPTPEQK